MLRTVKDVVEKLLKFPQDMEIRVYHGMLGEPRPIMTVEMTEHGEDCDDEDDYEEEVIIYPWD